MFLDCTTFESTGIYYKTGDFSHDNQARALISKELNPSASERVERHRTNYGQFIPPMTNNYVYFAQWTTISELESLVTQTI